MLGWLGPWKQLQEIGFLLPGLANPLVIGPSPVVDLALGASAGACRAPTSRADLRVRGLVHPGPNVRLLDLVQAIGDDLLRAHIVGPGEVMVNSDEAHVRFDLGLGRETCERVHSWSSPPARTAPNCSKQRESKHMFRFQPKEKPFINHIDGLVTMVGAVRDSATLQNAVDQLWMPSVTTRIC